MRSKLRSRVSLDNGLSWFLGGAEVFDSGFDALDGDTYMVNSYVTFETGAWIFAAEVSYGESESSKFAVGGIFNAEAIEDEDRGS